MSEPRAGAAPPAWQLAVVAALRTALGLALVITGLVLVPDTIGARGPLTMAVIVVVGLGVWIAYLRWSVKAIRRAQYPRVRSAELLVVSIALFLAVFASFYVTLSAQDPGAFTEELDHFSAYYFALTVLATVGFGDITPVTTIARGISMVQMAMDLFIIGVAVRILSGTAERALKERQAG